VIDLQLLENNPNSLFEIFISGSIETNRFLITRNQKNIYQFIDKSKNIGNIYNEDNLHYMKYFYRKLFEMNFDSILISGLGVGIVPLICQNTTNIIDVVEVDKEIIDFVSGFNHLQSNVNIINGDINYFTPTRQYDIILFDHWGKGASQIEKNNLTTTFQGFLNPNGILTFPIIEQFKNTN
jgi:spermidine synthase